MTKRRSSGRPDFNVYFPFGRKPEFREDKFQVPVCFTEEPSGWPCNEFKSFKIEPDKPMPMEFYMEEQFDKFAPVEKPVDTDALVFQYVSTMYNLEKSGIGMCCDKNFFDELRHVKKSIVPRRPNCPKIWPTNELQMFGPEAVKPMETRKYSRRPPTPPLIFKPTREPFDLAVDDEYPKLQRFIIPANRQTRWPVRDPMFADDFENTPNCKPVRRVKTIGCY